MIDIGGISDRIEKIHDFSIEASVSDITLILSLEKCEFEGN
jgi:hypothetical protein